MSTDQFTTRVLDHDRVARIDFGEGPGVIAINDQLIVRSGDVNNAFSDLIEHFVHFKPTTGKQTVRRLADILGPLRTQTADAYVVVEVAGLVDLKHDIFALVDYLREKMFKGREWHVAPNRIVIPSPHEGPGCPFGPPFPASRYAVAPASNGGDSPNITLIDSGYQRWWGDNTVTVKYRKQHKSSIFGKWGDNPLESVCDLVQVKETPWLQGTGHRLTPTDVIHAVGNEVVAPFQAVPGWNTTPSPLGDVPAANKQDLLDALAGHANFVAGVIAQGCDYPAIEIWNHNSAFLDRSDFSFASEAALCRSILHSQDPLHSMLSKPADVIHIGFALPLRDNKSVHLAGKQDFLSGLWTSTFESLFALYQQRGHARPMIVAPAGNESSNSPHFPAALATYFTKASNREAYKAQSIPSDLFDNVIGVGSLGPKASTPFTYDNTSLGTFHYGASSFSNYGDWVTCSAIGENVHSAFMPLHPMWREEDEMKDRQRVGFPYPAAFWNGTSFSAPKVTAAIAARVAPHLDSAGAWTALKMVNGQRVPHDTTDLGIRFDNL